MQRLEVSTAETSAGRMAAGNLRACARALEEDGCVLLPGVVDVGHVDALNGRMQEDIRRLERGRGVSNDWQGVRPPPCHPWLFRDIVFNDMAVDVLRAVLGEGLALDGYGANTAYPGEATQGVHGDGGQLWPGLDRAHPPFGLIVNIPLVDVDEENGATRFWPGTHKDVGTVMRRSEFVDPERVRRREAERPSERMCMRRGDLVVRDNRMWHCGTPNRTAVPRPMLTLIYIAPWWFRGGVEFEAGTEDFLKHETVAVNAVFVEPPIDYLAQGHSRPLRAAVGARRG